MALAEPPPQTMGARVSGALPRFPSAGAYADRGVLDGPEEDAAPLFDPAAGPAGARAACGEPRAAAAKEMMNACRGRGIDGNDFVVAHQVYRRLGGQDSEDNRDEQR